MGEEQGKADASDDPARFALQQHQQRARAKNIRSRRTLRTSLKKSAEQQTEKEGAEQQQPGQKSTPVTADKKANTREEQRESPQLGP